MYYGDGQAYVEDIIQRRTPDFWIILATASLPEEQALVWVVYEYTVPDLRVS